jgi:glycine/D-amino acid oxidase-like deaminating enzyme
MTDVTVRGAGIFGLSIAWACLQRGARVRVIEAAHIGAGSSGGLVGALAPHTPENWNPKKQFQLESLLMAGAFWGDVARASGLDPGSARSGRLQPLADARAIAQAERRAEGARTLWRGAADWLIEEATDDWRGRSPTGLWVRDTLSAHLHPRRAGAALAAAIRALGGVIEEGAGDSAPVGPGKPPAGIFENGRSEGPVIWATGVAGLEALSRDLGRPAGGGVKGQAALFRCAPGLVPQLFSDALHIVPHLDGTVAIGSTSERGWDDPASTDGQLDGLIEKARSLCPMLAAAPVINRWAGLRPRATSRAPILGPWPGHPGHFIANGGFKIGFGMAPKVAEVMADLVLDGRDAIPEGFRVEDNL